MPSADQVPVKSSHSTMRWHVWFVLIAGSTGSALRAVRLPNFWIPPGDRHDGSGCERDGFLIALTLRHHGPSHSRDLVGERDGRHFGRPPGQQRGEPGPMPGAVEFGIADHRQRPGREEATQISVTSFTDVAELFLAAARVLLGHQPDPSPDAPPRPEGPWLTATGDQSR